MRRPDRETWRRYIIRMKLIGLFDVDEVRELIGRGERCKLTRDKDLREELAEEWTPEIRHAISVKVEKFLLLDSEEQ